MGIIEREITVKDLSSISERLEILQTLHRNGIYSVLFMSPIFPGITDFKAIINVKVYRW